MPPKKKPREHWRKGAKMFIELHSTNCPEPKPFVVNVQNIVSVIGNKVTIECRGRMAQAITCKESYDEIKELIERALAERSEVT